MKSEMNLSGQYITRTRSFFGFNFSDLIQKQPLKVFSLKPCSDERQNGFKGLKLKCCKFLQPFLTPCEHDCFCLKTITGADPGFCQGGWLAGPKNFWGSSRGVWGGYAPPEKILKLKVSDWLKMHFLAPLQ